MLSIYQTKGKFLHDQYYDIGALFGKSIRESVKKLVRQRSKQAQIRKIVAEATLKNICNKKIAAEFLKCLKSWAKGAEITVEQAMWLMADNLSGCQTMMIRYKTGVAIMHTEEDFVDMSQHMTGEKVVSFLDETEISRCLVYNDLMPGAGLYGWKKDFIVAVDTLFLVENDIDKVQRPLLANVIAWLIWRMSPDAADPKVILKIISKMGELIDGYAINVVRKCGELVEGYKITLARTESRIEYLGTEIGSYLKQVNIVDPKYMPMKWALPPRHIWRGGYRHFLERLQNIDTHVSRYLPYTQKSLASEEIERAHFQIQKTIYTDLHDAYINDNVGAVCVGLIDKIGTSVSCKINDQKPYVQLEYLDLF